MKKIILLSKFIINQNNLNFQNKTFLCAVSGGQDSIVLFFIFLHLQKILNLKVKILHFNHFWHNDNFYSTSGIIKNSYLFNLPILLILPEIPIVSENIGHYWRKNKICQIYTNFPVDEIIFGHTASDQIETSLWHLLRGSGVDGLTSLKKQVFLKINTKFFKIPYSPENYKNKKIYKFYTKPTQFLKFYKFNNHFKKNIYKKKLTLKKKPIILRNYIFYSSVSSHLTITRPLLTIHRSDITSTVYENILPVYIDSSNTSIKYTRNKIRLIIIPLLRYYFHSKIDLNIIKFINIKLYEQENYQKQINTVLLLYLKNPKNISTYYSLNSIMKEYIIRYLLKRYTNNILSNLTYKQIQTIIFGSPGTRTRN